MGTELTNPDNRKLVRNQALSTVAAAIAVAGVGYACATSSPTCIVRQQRERELHVSATGAGTAWMHLLPPYHGEVHM